MAELISAIHVFAGHGFQGVDARDERARDRPGFRGVVQG
jgi:hypothetical protein